MAVDWNKIHEFEQRLNPARPEEAGFGVKVIGYGEISAVFSFAEPGLSGFAYKRMSVFDTENSKEAAGAYCDLFNRYESVLKSAGLSLPETDARVIQNEKYNMSVLYIAQHKFESEEVVSHIIRKSREDEAVDMLKQILGKMQLILEFNKKNEPYLQAGFDGQVSNWVQSGRLYYLDTGTPLIRENGRELLDVEIFLSITPVFMKWIIRKFFLADVVSRYYDMRLVLVDLLSNLYKEGRPDLIASLLDQCNEFLNHHGFQPVSRKEVDSYYREDAFIWRLFLSARRLERYLNRLRGKPYHSLLPGRVKR